MIKKNNLKNKRNNPSRLNLYGRLERARNSVSDETILRMNLGNYLTGNFYLRRKGDLVCATFENSVLPVSSVNLGSQEIKSLRFLLIN